ncbi:MAG: hypothetical protein V1887_02865 [Candidatus Aenigmatarchaeota archaeon]
MAAEEKPVESASRDATDELLAFIRKGIKLADGVEYTPFSREDAYGDRA